MLEMYADSAVTVRALSEWGWIALIARADAG